MQGAIGPQKPGMGKAFAARQHRHQETHQRSRRFDVIRRSPANRPLLPYLLYKADPAEKRNENREAVERSHYALGLAQDQPFIR
jgi:hypothetical protein